MLLEVPQSLEVEAWCDTRSVKSLITAWQRFVTLSITELLEKGVGFARSALSRHCPTWERR